VREDGPNRPNVLLITFDQFRGDCLSLLGHPVVRTPNLDAFARECTVFARHYSQAAPCSPGRASLYTGMYQSNHRVCFNGSPLDDRFDNIARFARRQGYSPALFGYTDQGVDPRTTTSSNDPRLSTYQGVLPGFDCILDLSEPYEPWLELLRSHGYDFTDSVDGRRINPEARHIAALETESERDASLSQASFLTDEFQAWLQRRDDANRLSTQVTSREPWFAHLSYLRPHPPYVAAGEWAHAYQLDDVGVPIAPTNDPHPFHEAIMQLPDTRAPSSDEAMRRMRSQYFGMVSAVDAQFARLVTLLHERDEWDETIIIVTADHGEQLGDHGLREKVGFFEQSYHIVGMIRDPRQAAGHGQIVEAFTENVDLFPTLCDLLDAPIPAQCDGRSLRPWLTGNVPDDWREMATWEYDWRQWYITDSVDGSAIRWPDDRRLERQNLCVQRDERSAYVQFGNGDWLAFDLDRDSTWRTLLHDSAAVLPLAQRMLTWRSQHLERTLSGMKLEDGGQGRWPDGIPWRSTPWKSTEHDAPQQSPRLAE
jgi:arylsulfatase A-like enzyme